MMIGEWGRKNWPPLGRWWWKRVIAGTKLEGKKGQKGVDKEEEEENEEEEERDDRIVGFKKSGIRGRGQ